MHHLLSVLNKATDPSVLSNLINSDEEAVSVASVGAGVQGLFVLLDFPLDKISGLLYMSKNSLVVARKMVHDPGKDVVHLLGKNKTALFV